MKDISEIWKEKCCMKSFFSANMLSKCLKGILMYVLLSSVGFDWQ